MALFGLLGAGAALLGPLIQLYLTLVALTLAGQEPPGNTEEHAPRSYSCTGAGTGTGTGR